MWHGDFITLLNWSKADCHFLLANWLLFYTVIHTVQLILQLLVRFNTVFFTGQNLGSSHLCTAASNCCLIANNTEPSTSFPFPVHASNLESDLIPPSRCLESVICQLTSILCVTVSRNTNLTVHPPQALALLRCGRNRLALISSSHLSYRLISSSSLDGKDCQLRGPLFALIGGSNITISSRGLPEASVALDERRDRW